MSAPEQLQIVLDAIQALCAVASGSIAPPVEAPEPKRFVKVKKNKPRLLAAMISSSDILAASETGNLTTGLRDLKS